MKYNFIQPQTIELDDHFTSFAPLAQWLLSPLHLDEAQIQQLYHPEINKCEDVAVRDMIAFLEGIRKRKEKVIICGDYDCDGVSATSLMVLLCQQLEIEYGYYIPNRIVEGYGLNENTVLAAHQKGYQNIICVDNGVAAHSALAAAKQCGIAVAIIDHHVIHEMPVCEVLLHPDVLSPYFSAMCGAGLVFLICEHYLWSPLMVSLACIATIGDMMPLWGKNRELVLRGCEALNKQRIRSIDLLHEPRVYTATSIAFNLVPKINAVGRLADRANVNNVVRYFTMLDDSELESFAAQMNEMNQLRKQMSKQYTLQASQMIEDTPMIILESESFHEGLVGIVAGQLSNSYRKPALVLANRDGHLKGSARSQSISLQAIFKSIDPELFINFGGHDHAAGVELNESTFRAFKEAIYTHLLHDGFEDTTIVDVIQLETNDLSINALEQLQIFEPFGQAFKLPFVSLNLEAKAIKLGQAGFKWNFPGGEVVYFGTRKFPQTLQTYTFIGTLSINEFRGKKVVQLLADDIISQ